MNFVEKSPFLNFSSAIIFLCSGIVVFIPSTTIMSRARFHTADRQFTCSCMNDQFRDHRIVIRRNDISRINSRIDSYAGTAGNIEGRDLARTRRKFDRIFGVDAAFDRMADDLNIFLREMHICTGRDHDLIADNIGKRDHFRYRMFDLNARVHFHKIKLNRLRQAKIQKFPHSNNRSLCRRLRQQLPFRARCSGVITGDGASSKSF